MCGDKIKGLHFDGSERMWEVLTRDPIQPRFYIEEGCLALYDEQHATVLAEKTRYVPPRTQRNRRKRERRARRGK